MLFLARNKPSIILSNFHKHVKFSIARKSTKLGATYSANGCHDYGQLRSEFENVKVPQKYNFARDVIDKWASSNIKENNSNNLAFWFVKSDGGELKWTYQELSHLSKKTANVMLKCGIQKGDVILATLPKTPEWWLLYLASVRIGAIFCPGTSMLTSDDIKYRLTASKAKHIICNRHTFPAVSKGAQMHADSVTKIYVGSESDKIDGWINFNSLLANASSDQHECEDTSSNDPMTIFFTSGTTGKPKIVEHTQASYGFAHQVTGRIWLDLTENDTIYALSDPGWAKAAWSNFFASWYQGSCIFIDEVPKFNPNRILKTLEQYPISVFCAAPTAYRMLIQEDLTQFKFGNLRHCVSAGEPLNPEVFDQWYDKTGLSIREGYGQTETVVLCGSFPCLPIKPGSMGKATPGITLKIIDDDGHEVPTGHEGVVAVSIEPKRPVGLFTGYSGDEAKTKAAFDGNYYRTGDRASMDKDGYLWFISCDDDIINSSGYRIGPFEVESVLLEHPSVVEAAVVSSPDLERSEVVKAFVVLQENCVNVDKDSLIKELQKFVREKTAPYKYPRKVEFVNELPKTVSGKTRRIELRQKEWQNAS